MRCNDLKIPPPLASPHVIELLVLALHVFEYPLWRKLHVLTESGVPNQFFNALDGIPLPQLDLLCQHCLTTGVPHVHLVSSNLENFAGPFWYIWQCVDLLQQRPIIMK